MVLDWALLARTAVDRWGTPLYLLQRPAVDAAFKELESIRSLLPTRHWLSCKTLAVAPLLERWRAAGRGIEVVSPFELKAALSAGFTGDRILVNGTAKHRWLESFETLGLHVQVDSLGEAASVAALVAPRRWEVGIRIHTKENVDPDDEAFQDQFGVPPADIRETVDLLRRHGLIPRCVSFHLRSNLSTIAPYISALEETAAICAVNGLRPDYLDIGGGLPAPGEIIRGVNGGAFNLGAMSDVYARAHELFPSVREIWLESGRFVSSRAGALVVRIWDVKEFGGMRYLICDGGRVNHAFPSDWQTHTIDVLPKRGGDSIPSAVCGPTCMAYDVLTRSDLPADIRAGDMLIWHNAGAYHLAWETRFSFGLAPIVWFESDATPRLVRAREAFDSWWPSYAETHRE